MVRYLHWVALVILIVAAPAVATTEISICSDDALSSVSFRANVPGRLFWIDDIDVFSQTSGTSVLGTSISFGACLTPPIHVLTMRFFGTPYPEDECAFMWIKDAAGIDCGAQPVPIVKWHYENRVWPM